jgi:hypothetical protein
MSDSSRSQTAQRLPRGALAWREYKLKLLSGRTVILAFSLGDPDDFTIARVKRERAAANLGLLIVMDDPDSSEEVVLWFQRATSLTLMSQNGDMLIGDEVSALLPRYFTAFFDEVKDLAPGLADVIFAPTSAPHDKNLH